MIAVAAGAMQLYWYYQRYFHMTEDGKAEDDPYKPLLSIKETSGIAFEHKTANFVSNWVAFALSVGSWYFIICWIVSAHTKGVAT